MAARLQKIRFIGLQISFKKQKDVVADTITKYGVMVDIAGLEKIQLTLAQIYEMKRSLARQSLTLEFT